MDRFNGDSGRVRGCTAALLMPNAAKRNPDNRACLPLAG